ncbi:MAG: hypothetical protein ACREV3_03015 [Gammaproteobacteria bacterium]
MDEETLTAEILQHLNGATQPITARQIFEGIASHVPMPALAGALHNLRVGGKIAGERQDGSKPLVYRALREGETPSTASRVARAVGGSDRGNGDGRLPNPAPQVEDADKTESLKSGNGAAGDLDVKGELYSVIESMVHDNEPLLKLIRLYGRC